jgi:hypothetical protein
VGSGSSVNKCLEPGCALGLLVGAYALWEVLGRISLPNDNTLQTLMALGVIVGLYLLVHALVVVPAKFARWMRAEEEIGPGSSEPAPSERTDVLDLELGLDSVPSSTETRCPYCHTECARDFTCPACDVAHHEDCFTELGRCAVCGASDGERETA